LRRLRWDKERLVEEANIFAEEVLALPGPPPLQAKTVGKMGLKGVRGLNVLKGPPGNPPGSGRGGGGGKGRRW
jgi:ATP-dependent RNA helicase MSS116